MTTTLHQLARLNNNGCDSLDQGDFTKATAQFKTALSHARSFIEYQSTRQPLNHGTAVSRSILGMPSHLYPNIPGNPIVEELQDKFVVHTQAIRLFEGYSFSRVELDNSKIYTAIIVFNLALTTHLQGLKTLSHRCLQQAATLYTHTYQLVYTIVNDCYRGQATGNAAFDLLILALFNNMALVHLAFSEYEHASVIFQHLMKYAVTFPRQGRDQVAMQCTGVASECDGIYNRINDFVLNATLSGCKSPIAAAAA